MLIAGNLQHACEFNLCKQDAMSHVGLLLPFLFTKGLCTINLHQRCDHASNTNSTDPSCASLPCLDETQCADMITSYGHADFIEKEAERLAELIKKDVKRDNAIWKIGNMEQGIAQLKQQVLPIRRRTLFYENGTPQVALKTVFTKPSPLGGCQRRITELRTKGDNHGVQNHTRRV